MSKDMVCSICLGEMDPKLTSLQECPNGHKHHMSCIGKWCEKYDSNGTVVPQCPCCKCDLPQKKEDWVLINKDNPFFINIKTGDRGWDIPHYALISF